MVAHLAQEEAGRKRKRSRLAYPAAGSEVIVTVFRGLISESTEVKGLRDPATPRPRVQFDVSIYSLGPLQTGEERTTGGIRASGCWAIAAVTVFTLRAPRHASTSITRGVGRQRTNYNAGIYIIKPSPSSTTTTTTTDRVETNKTGLRTGSQDSVEPVLFLPQWDASWQVKQEIGAGQRAAGTDGIGRFWMSLTPGLSLPTPPSVSPSCRSIGVNSTSSFHHHRLLPSLPESSLCQLYSLSPGCSAPPSTTPTPIQSSFFAARPGSQSQGVMCTRSARGAVGGDPRPPDPGVPRGNLSASPGTHSLLFVNPSGDGGRAVVAPAGARIRPVELRRSGENEEPGSPAAGTTALISKPKLPADPGALLT
ncbi:unnamed protein product [Lota lota]